MKRLLVPLALLGISCSTPYQPVSDSKLAFLTRGYQVSELNEDIYEVSFRAASHEESRARDFVIIRSAEICSSDRFEYFRVLLDRSAGGRSESVILGLVQNSTPVLVVNRIQCVDDGGAEGAIAVARVLNKLRSKYSL